LDTDESCLFYWFIGFNIDNKEYYIKKVSLFDEFTKEKFYDKLTLYYIETKSLRKKKKNFQANLITGFMF